MTDAEPTESAESAEEKAKKEEKPRRKSQPKIQEEGFASPITVKRKPRRREPYLPVIVEETEEDLRGL